VPDINRRPERFPVYTAHMHDMRSASPAKHPRRNTKLRMQNSSEKLNQKISSISPDEMIQWLNVVPGAFAVPIPVFADDPSMLSLWSFADLLLELCDLD
jgi:hypothetical protein